MTVFSASAVQAEFLAREEKSLDPIGDLPHKLLVPKSKQSAMCRHARGTVDVGAQLELHGGPRSTSNLSNQIVCSIAVHQMRMPESSWNTSTANLSVIPEM